MLGCRRTGLGGPLGIGGGGGRTVSRLSEPGVIPSTRVVRVPGAWSDRRDRYVTDHDDTVSVEVGENGVGHAVSGAKDHADLGMTYDCGKLAVEVSRKVLLDAGEVAGQESDT